jgi:hypothetical protein
MKRVILTAVVSTMALVAPSAEAAGTPPPGIYIRFVKYGGGATGGAGVGGAGTCAPSASTVVISEQNGPSKYPAWHPIQSMKFDIEQTLNIGSQSSGAGAGKITFNPLSITLPASSLDATLVDVAASGSAFCEADLMLVSAQGPTELFSMRIAAVKTVSFVPDSTGHSTTTATFEYGGLIVVNQSYKVDGTPAKAFGKGWDRVKNVALPPSATDLALNAFMP